MPGVPASLVVMKPVGHQFQSKVFITSDDAGLKAAKAINGKLGNSAWKEARV